MVVRAKNFQSPVKGEPHVVGTSYVVWSHVDPRLLPPQDLLQIPLEGEKFPRTLSIYCPDANQGIPKSEHERLPLYGDLRE